MKIRVIKHEVTTGWGSYEVRFPDGRPSKYFYFENLPGRRVRPDRVEQAVAEQNAERFAREERDKLDSQRRPASAVSTWRPNSSENMRASATQCRGTLPDGVSGL